MDEPAVHKGKRKPQEPDYRGVWMLERAKAVWPDAIRVREREVGDSGWELVVETPSFHHVVATVNGPHVDTSSRAVICALEAMGEKERELAPLQRALEKADREQRDLAFVDRDAAYELVERDLIAAGVKIATFKYWPKNDPYAVGSCVSGGPFIPGTLKHIAESFASNRAYAEKYHAEELSRKRRERAAQAADGAKGSAR